MLQQNSSTTTRVKVEEEEQPPSPSLSELLEKLVGEGCAAKRKETAEVINTETPAKKAQLETVESQKQNKEKV